MAEITLDLLGKRLDELQGEATHYRLVFGVILDEIKTLRGRIDILDSRIELVEKRLGGRMDKLEELITTRFDTLETLLRDRLTK